MNTKMKKNLGLLVLVVAVAFAIAKGGTSLAYFFANKTADDNYTVAQVDTDINEDVEEKTDTSYTKKPTVENVGKSDCIVRVKVSFSNSDDAKMIKLIADDSDVTAGVTHGKWVYHDGYYYYQGILAKGESTTALFDTVVLESDLAKDADFDIIVNNEAIQTTAYDSDGNKAASAMDDNGNYNQSNALKLWQYYSK